MATVGCCGMAKERAKRLAAEVEDEVEELELKLKAVRGSLVFSTRVNFLPPYTELSLQTQSESCPSRKIGGGGIRFETQPPFATHAH